MLARIAVNSSTITGPKASKEKIGRIFDYRFVLRLRHDALHTFLVGHGRHIAGSCILGFPEQVSNLGVEFLKLKIGDHAVTSPPFLSSV